MSIALLPFCGIVFLYQGMAERYDYLASEGLAFAVMAAALCVPRQRMRAVVVSVVAQWERFGERGVSMRGYSTGRMKFRFTRAR